jgi:hypothetical protein
MTDFAFVGKKRSGKSKHAVYVMRDYLRRGCRVASNMDLNLAAMFGNQSRATYVRVPDFPTVLDLQAIGKGIDDGYDEDRFGALVMDELGVWFNARDFTDKNRVESLRWLVHSGKLCWDVYYLLHDPDQGDKQLRVSFFEFTVRHTGMRKVKIPFVGWILNALFGGRVGYFPPFTMYSTRLGTNPQGLRTDGGTLFSNELHACYNTQQTFTPDYPHGAHSVLSPWHVEGRFCEPALPWWRRVFRAPVRPPSAPYTSPDPEFARVVHLCRALPPEQRLSLISRYSRMRAYST